MKFPRKPNFVQNLPTCRLAWTTLPQTVNKKDCEVIEQAKVEIILVNVGEVSSARATS